MKPNKVEDMANNVNIIVNDAIDDGVNTFIVAGLLFEKSVRITVEKIMNEQMEHAQEKANVMFQNMQKEIIKKALPIQSKSPPKEEPIAEETEMSDEEMEEEEADVDFPIRGNPIAEDVIYEEVVEKPKKEKKPRKLTEFNIFMGEYLIQHKGELVHKELFKKATEEWKKRKG